MNNLKIKWDDILGVAFPFILLIAFLNMGA